ncbi:hypothetical protein [Paracoccus sp. SJTW-4]|uniref:hypothetical protein n=1 Tax=Paracoccus sp. SJTW-4 TaxID=3078428 RepID=UPI0039EA63E2
METRAEVYTNAAGLLVRLGFAARVEPSFTNPREPRPVIALVTDAPPVLIGHAISQVAADPEPHLPTTSANARKAETGEPQLAWWV